MIKKEDFERIRKQVEDNPSLLDNPANKAVVDGVSILEDIDNSIEALNNSLQGNTQIGNGSYVDNLNKAWDELKNNAEPLPYLR